ncbi:putative eukaryotic translation initiation factor 3 subunit M isoform X3 [Apostichopus japonicus]|uniref:Eukaryotic translation initiation factor 3 subunit M n=1 Tax=Stichopus japonicus TaxID=307972 RepID=A0A2G8L1T7_STIJA|nr:putative eukaryotic translation initiation factor 3 subunit M isoform X3 [Apostichopus japonicus]
MNFTTFISLQETEQAGEIKSYLKSQGANIGETLSEKGIQEDLYEILQAVGIVWKNDEEQDIEALFNSILSLLIYLPVEDMSILVPKVSDHLVAAAEGQMCDLRLKILSSLFHGVGEQNALSYIVYCCMLQVAAQAKSCELMQTELDQVRDWIKLWQLDQDKICNLLSLLYEALKESKLSEEASKVMVELLGTYTEDNASQARDEAHRCIENALADPNVYLFDHLLTLRPVKFLEGERIHELLTIFVSGNLEMYQDFYNTNRDFIQSLALNQEETLRKMRILTFMGIAVDQKEISFDQIIQTLKITEEEVENFIIEVVKSKMAKVKIDQKNRKVFVSYVTHRTFGKHQWQQLRDILTNWQKNLVFIRDRLDTVATPQEETQ